MLVVDVRPYLPHFVGVHDRPRLGVGGFCCRDRPELPLEAHHLPIQPSVPWGKIERDYARTRYSLQGGMSVHLLWPPSGTTVHASGKLCRVCDMQRTEYEIPSVHATVATEFSLSLLQYFMIFRHNRRKRGGDP